MPFRKETWRHNEPARLLYIAIVIASSIAMAVLFVQISNDRSSINREANIRATQIQQQRYDVTFNNCTDQNIRHDTTIKKLQKIYTDYAKTHPQTRAQVRKAIQQNILLIDALVPSRNCKSVAEKAVQPLPAPNNNGR